MTRSQPRQVTTSSRVQGSDLLEIITVDASRLYKVGETIASGIITSSSSARLETLSRAYQRGKWHRLRFTVEGAFPTLAGGGYIACFVRDPSDVPPNDPMAAVRWAMAQQHSVDAKWYDSVTLNVGQHPDLLYNSSADTLRLFSPGTLFIVSKGGPAQVGTLTISFHWDLTLSEPTIDRPLDEGTVRTKDALYIEFAPVAWAALCHVEQTSASPHDLTYTAIPNDYFGNFAVGTYFRLRRPIAMSGVYNTWNDYVPIWISGFTILGNNRGICAVYENAGGYYVVAKSQSEAGTVPDGYLLSDWKQWTGGIGQFLPPNTTLDVLTVHNTNTPGVGEFTSNGLKYKPTSGPRFTQSPVIDDTAQVALTSDTIATLASQISAGSSGSDLANNVKEIRDRIHACSEMDPLHVSGVINVALAPAETLSVHVMNEVQTNVLNTVDTHVTQTVPVQVNGVVQSAIIGTNGPLEVDVASIHGHNINDSLPVYATDTLPVNVQNAVSLNVGGPVPVTLTGVTTTTPVPTKSDDVVNALPTLYTHTDGTTHVPMSIATYGHNGGVSLVNLGHPIPSLSLGSADSTGGGENAPITPFGAYVGGDGNTQAAFLSTHTVVQHPNAQVHGLVTAGDL